MAEITVEIAYQYALAHRQAGRLAEAEALLRQVVAALPHNANAWHQLGVVVLTAGRPVEAVDLLTRAITESPGTAYVYSDLGVAYSHLDRSSEAIASFQRALQLQPTLAHTHRNLGDVLYALDRKEEAITCYRRALALDPKDASAHNNLGSVLQKMGQLENAAACYERAVQLDPQLLEAQSNFGDTLTKTGRLEEGLACNRRVLALNPDFPDGHLNMGVTYCLMCRFPESEASYRRAIALRPDFANAHLNLGLLLLLLGRYAEGWPEYEWRWRSPAHLHRHRSFSAPLWDGKPVEGKTILIHAEQGFGDTLLFVRYLPLVLAQSRAARLVFECQPTLIPLLKQLQSSQIAIVAREVSDEMLPPFDLHLPLFSMPLTLQHFAPMAPSYLQADAELRARWRERLGNGGEFRVGLAWAGNPMQDEDRRRSLAPSQLVPILAVPGVRFVSLQVEPRGPLPPVLTAAGVTDCTAHIADFADSAALMAELDLIITVDTATAHLAGALGRPAWVLVPAMPYWPYGVGREDTPWYPTMRLFRQGAPGGWDEVLARIATALR